MATLMGDFAGADYSTFHSRAPGAASATTLAASQTSQAPLKTSESATTASPHHHHSLQQPSHHQAPLHLQQTTTATVTVTATAAAAAASAASARATTSVPCQPQSPPLSSSNQSSQGKGTPIGIVPNPNTSRIPTPPDSSLPSYPDGIPAAMAPTETETESTTASEPSSASTVETVVPAPTAARPPPPTNAIPSPASDGSLVWNQTHAASSSAVPHPIAVGAPATPLPPPQRIQKTIRIHDLNHIQRLASMDSTTGNGPGILNDPPLQDMKFEISSMPIADIIEMVAALLTKITTTNDHQHDALHRNASQQRQAQAHNDGTDSHASPFSTSVLAFHGKNVPAITILSYLSRIHKYCPTTYEVFLSLLVYFDRITERVNELVLRDEEARRARAEQRRRDAAAAAAAAAASSSTAASNQPSRQGSGSGTASRPRSEPDVHMRDTDAASTDVELIEADETDEDLADSSDEDEEPVHHIAGGHSFHPDPASLMSTYFVVDSFNIHRLIIAGVTCASKFFSDVFYTNSRYAKVGGLPLAELNHLELQFLILNDFRLAIPIEDLEAYATMLVEFYAREVVGTRPRPSG